MYVFPALAEGLRSNGVEDGPIGFVVYVCMYICNSNMKYTAIARMTLHVGLNSSCPSTGAT